MNEIKVCGQSYNLFVPSYDIRAIYSTSVVFIFSSLRRGLIKAWAESNVVISLVNDNVGFPHHPSMLDLK
jgi:hypothetical protein